MESGAGGQKVKKNELDKLALDERQADYSTIFCARKDMKQPLFLEAFPFTFNHNIANINKKSKQLAGDKDNILTVDRVNENH